MSWRDRLGRASRRRPLAVWHHPELRLPFTSIEQRTGLDPRRGELVLWFALQEGCLRPEDLFVPARASYIALARVHPLSWLEALLRPEEVGWIFGVEPWDVPVDAVLGCLRRAVGATMEAAAFALRTGRPAMCLSGGFHHAHRDRGHGFCAVNDIAVAIAALRADGFAGPVGVIDVDAHPADGTADCLSSDPAAWIRSLSGMDWGPYPPVLVERIAPAGCGGPVYLRELRALLSDLPPAELIFVVAGADVRAGDPLSPFALSEEDLAARDGLLVDVIGDRPSVWLPAGGYGREAFRPYARLLRRLATGWDRPLSPGVDPLRARFLLSPPILVDDDDRADEIELSASFGMGPPPTPRLFGRYSAEALSQVLASFGLDAVIERLGYRDLRHEIDRTGMGERVRLYGLAAGAEHLLVELVLEPQPSEGRLFVHWLTLRHPVAGFRLERPPLPGQEVPGLGLVRECVAMMLRLASRLGLAGLRMVPAWLHVAYAARRDFHFVDPARQALFLALLRDLGAVPMGQLSRDLAAGRVRCDGGPFAWAPAPMDCLIDGAPPEVEPAAHVFTLQAPQLEGAGGAE